MKPQPNVGACAAALAALIIAVDGVIDPREENIAISLGRQMFMDFPAQTFKDLLCGITSPPQVTELAQVLSLLLDTDGKTLILEYLVALAVADEHVVHVELTTLQDVARGLKIDAPSILPYRVESSDQGFVSPIAGSPKETSQDPPT